MSGHSNLDLALFEIAVENAARHHGKARMESVLGRALALHPELRGDPEVAKKLVSEAVERVNALPERDLIRLWKERSSGRPEPSRSSPSPEEVLPPLPNARPGGVVLRFAPFPSGPLHIGNSRAVFVNDEYRRRYRGRFLLVLDDTAGSEDKKILPEAYDLIPEDLDLVGVRVDAILYKSDRLERHYHYVPQLIAQGDAYVCTCPADQLRENRRRGRACPERDRPPEFHLEHWERMKAGGYRTGEAVLRLKTSLADPDPAFRDRVLFRIWEGVHPRVGTRYRVWPLLEYSWAIDDVELGITHVIRGKDLIMEGKMEETLWQRLRMVPPVVINWGLLRVRDAKISKSKSAREVQTGVYDGWSDPRTWTLRSLLRRGIRPEALRAFILSFGLSQADIEVPAEALYAENRRLLDPTTPRRIFVPRPRKVRVVGFPPDLREITLPNHPDREELGSRTLPLDGRFVLPEEDLLRHRGDVIRLKDLLNARVPPSWEGGEIPLEFVDRPNRPLPRIQWLPSEFTVQTDVLLPDGILVSGLGERTLEGSREGEVFQFERFGFVRLDSPPRSAQGSLRFVYGHP